MRATPSSRRSASRLDARLSFHRRPLLVPAQLGQDAGLLGAALIARERVGEGEATSSDGVDEGVGA